MKRMLPSEVRQRWFEVLDRVSAGEVIGVERHGRLVVIRRDDQAGDAAVPDYRGIIRIPKSSEADRWSWEWAPHRGLKPKVRKA